MSFDRPGISLVLPAFNEADIIYQMASEAARAMSDLERDFEIIIVDDGSSDETPLEVERAAIELDNVSFVTLPENQGKGNALKRGFQASSKELVCFLDADLDLHPGQTGRLLQEMDETGANIVIGSKRHPGSKLEYPWYRKLYSTTYYLLILLLFRLPIRDTQTGIKLFEREVLARTLPRLVSKRYALDLELLVVACRLGYSVAEAPVTLSYRRQFGRIKWVDIRNIIVDTLAVFYRLHILRYYSCPLRPIVPGEPRISIVIPSRGLDPMARECLHKCGELNYSNFDIKFVTEDPLVQEIGPPGSEVIVSGPIGPSEKRNLGVGASSADIVAFLHSDSWPDFDWLRNAVPYFEDGDVAGVCGPAVTPASDSRRQQASGFIYSSSLVSGSATYRYAFHSLRTVDDYPSCNLLVRRSDFNDVGGFPEEFWPGEDTVLCMKLVKETGRKLLYVPNVVTYHHRRPVYLLHLRQVAAYARQRGFFVRRFPATSRRLQYFLPSTLVLGILGGFIASFFSSVALRVYVLMLLAYILTVLLSSIKSLDLFVNMLVLPGIMLTHFTYGISFMQGLLSPGIEKRDGRTRPSCKVDPEQ